MLTDLLNVYSFPLKIMKTQCSVNKNDALTFVMKNLQDWFVTNEDYTTWQKIDVHFGLIIVSTIFFGIKVHRQTSENSKAAPKVMFAKITKKNAEKSITNLIKFLFNYGYYYFGIEITLMTFVAVAFTRMDLTSIIYGLVFTIIIIVFNDRTESFERIWNVATYFIGAMIIVQCVHLGYVTIIIKACLVEGGYNFGSQMHFLALNNLYENPWNLTFDFILLTMMCCQVTFLQKSYV